jgi:uncharacterized membrane protein YhiD involved in acid resistance
VLGLTTAAGIWTVGAIGLAVGSGMYVAGVGCALLAGVILASERALRLNKLFLRLREAWMARDQAASGGPRGR